MAAKLSGPGGGDRYTTHQNSDINVTPFVDIMLVLLIIFMVSIPMATVSIKLDMPPAPINPPPPKHPPVFINILENGTILIVDKPTTLEGLPGDLGATLRSNAPEVADPRDNSVFIKADADVKYETFMEVLNKLEDTGFVKIGLINEDIK
jgi:biopolymer transport protein ExbD